MHEIGHSIGLQHEQSRPDRDSFVTIVSRNIKSGMSFNFNKKSYSQVDSLNTPYDYDSMMHYGKTAFGNGRVTIITKDKRYQDRIGQRRGFSKVDIQQINKMYCCEFYILYFAPKEFWFLNKLYLSISTVL